MKDLHNEVLGGSISELPALKNIPIQLETTNNENFNNTEKGLFPKSSNNVQKTVSGRNQINNHSPLKKLNYNNTAIYKISPEPSAKQKFTPEKFVITQQMLRGDVSQESLLKSPNEVSSKVTASYEKVIPAIERPNSNDLLQSLSIIKESNKAFEVSIKKLNLEKVQNYQQLCGTDSENKQRSQYSYRNKNSKDAEADFNCCKAIEEAKSYKDFQANKSSFVQKSSYTPRGETPKPGDWGMSDAEKKVYGDRTPKDYTKVNLLGRGGCAIVWLAKNLLTEKIVAIKQFPKNQGSVGSAKVEELIFSNLNSKSNLNHEGSESISHLLETIDENKDLWLVYEVGGDSLSKALFNVKGEFHKGERIYFIHHQELYHAIKSDKNVLRQLLRKLFEAFDLLHQNGIVHADLKSDNILVSYKDSQIVDVKVIDFGSAFMFDTAREISMSTPEYLAPEILGYLSNRNKGKFKEGVMSVFKTMKIWSYDTSIIYCKCK